MKSKLLLLFTFSILATYGQTVVCSRSASLQGSGSYTATGTAFLEKYNDGTLKLRLSSDFSTSSGPDVQIYLSNNAQASSGGVPIVDLSAVGHFSGAKTFDVPQSADISSHQYVVLECVQYTVFWGNGTLGSVTGNCNPTSTSKARNNAIKLFPNPTSNLINFTQAISNVRIFNLQGSLMIEKQNVTKVDVSALAKGTYLAVYDGKSERVVIK